MISDQSFRKSWEKVKCLFVYLLMLAGLIGDDLLQTDSGTRQSPGGAGFGFPLSSTHEPVAAASGPKRSPFQVLPVDKVFNLPNISLGRKNCPEHLNSYFSNLPFNRH